MSATGHGTAAEGAGRASARRPKLIHLTTVDLSLRALLLNQLVRFADEGFDVVGVSAPGPNVAEIEAAGIRHVPVPWLTRSWTPGRDARAAAALLRIFRAERPDIVHTHNPKTGVLGRMAARAAGVPVVVNTVHGLYAPADLGVAKRTIVRSAERVAARFSHFELFQSDEDYRWALRTGLVPRDRAAWLGNGVDVRRFRPRGVSEAARSAIRRRWGVGDRLVVGTVGRLVREKGYFEFFRAADMVRAAWPDAVFVAVGPEESSKDDALTPGVLDRVRASEAVVLAGEASGEEMPAVYAAFDVFALPSHREGVPRSAIEAMATGLPVVATRIRGSREVVLDGVTGLLVPPHDAGALARAVLRLIGDVEMARAFGEAGRARAADRFDEDLVIGRTLDVYARLLRERGR